MYHITVDMSVPQTEMVSSNAKQLGKMTHSNLIGSKSYNMPDKYHLINLELLHLENYLKIMWYLLNSGNLKDSL